MSAYTADAATLSLQRAARERVRAMQRRGQTAVAIPVPTPGPPAETEPAPPPAAERSQPAPQPRRAGGLSSLLSPLLGQRQAGGEPLSSLGETLRSAVGAASQPLGQLLDSFGLDGEELMILLVMYAVFSERGDTSLLLALGYLLL